MEKKIPYKIYLSEEEMPTKWYNVRADMPTKPAPLISPADGHALTLEEMNPIFCEELNKQELDNDTRYFDIPQEVLDFYRMYRPSPLVRAYFLEKELGRALPPRWASASSPTIPEPADPSVAPFPRPSRPR